ncbi:thiopurine S-methyltransferase [Pontibacter ummariensis]|uniref:Thiopurine S-methyltransferase (TPMT) n=1 Tax=Pontibacter ummariensis TaxID=1610492 RepID=A0A239FB61_9BACT|nr:SAM-dependent methyltransferase [Pontibacter ummariensis]PRY12336.1 thiopurine S-methyltransferase [Pontibacter ummariensis]SNS54129.1 Thiopurine S-methyltransferase (TPMT) [Pontibacter ummariensis]
MVQEFNAAYWQQRYQNGETGWDTGDITTPLKEYFDQLQKKNLRILIPGCGNAYEAEYLFWQGFKQVFVADVAAAPLQHFAQRVPGFPKDHLLQQDFFELRGTFDLLVEQTFFCALDPALRPKYASKSAELLKHGGKLVGLLFDTTFAHAGPPFGGNRQEYSAYFAPYFNFLHFDTAYNSIKPRQGRELFILLEKKDELEG